MGSAFEVTVPVNIAARAIPVTIDDSSRRIVCVLLDGGNRIALFAAVDAGWCEDRLRLLSSPVTLPTSASGRRWTGGGADID